MENCCEKCSEFIYGSLPRCSNSACECHVKQTSTSGDWEQEYDDRFWSGEEMLSPRKSMIACKDFIRKTLLERDEFWQAQEMGKSSDCAEHCEKAVLEERTKLVGLVEGLHKDHSKCPLPQTCIGYENAKEDITHLIQSHE